MYAPCHSPRFHTGLAGLNAAAVAQNQLSYSEHVSDSDPASIGSISMNSCDFEILSDISSADLNLQPINRMVGDDSDDDDCSSMFDSPILSSIGSLSFIDISEESGQSNPSIDHSNG